MNALANAVAQALGNPGARAIVIALALPAVAAAQAMLPQEKTEGGIAYVSGGIGQNEAMAMRRAAREYPLSMIFSAGPRGAFLADVSVTIKDDKGKTMLETVSAGPIMLVDLPAGDYRVAATVAGKTLHRAAKVGEKEGHARVSFNWPSPEVR